MKKSSKILAGTMIVLVAAAFIGIIGGRLYLNSVIGSDYKSDARITLEEERTTGYQLEDFSSIEFKGTWKIRITAADAYSIRVTAPSNLLEQIEVSQSGESLTVENNNDFILKEDTVSIEITMPELKGLMVSGAVDLDFEGFSGENFRMMLSGAGRIRGLNSRYENIELVCSGAGQLDFTDCLSVNADVMLSGAGEILLNMDGGVLGGNISGMGSVEYDGTIRENRLNVSGLGSISSR